MTESTTIRFIQILPYVSTKGDYLLRDLPGSGKRIDVLCRDLAACFDWAPITWQKSKLEMVAIIEHSKILRFQDPQNQIQHGETGWATAIRDSLRGNPPNFISVTSGTLEDLVVELNQPPTSMFWVLDESGVNISEVQDLSPSTQNSFMLGDYRGFDSQTVSIISRYEIQKISLGKKSYLSSHCLAAIISEFERMVR